MKQHYTIYSRITFGDYKGRIVNDLPIGYLMEIYGDPKRFSSLGLSKFIEKNIDVITNAFLDGKTKLRDVESLQPFIYQVPKDNYKIKRSIDPEKFLSEVKCSTGKTGYAARGDAVKALKSLKKLSSRSRKYIPLIEYRCKECGEWHLTSKKWRAKNPLIDV